MNQKMSSAAAVALFFCVGCSGSFVSQPNPNSFNQVAQQAAERHAEFGVNISVDTEKETFDCLIKIERLRYLRLIVAPSDVTDAAGQINFDVIDDVLDRCAQKKTKVILVIEIVNVSEDYISHWLKRYGSDHRIFAIQLGDRPFNKKDERVGVGFHRLLASVVAKTSKPIAINFEAIKAAAFVDREQQFLKGNTTVEVVNDYVNPSGDAKIKRQLRYVGLDLLFSQLPNSDEGKGIWQTTIKMADKLRSIGYEPVVTVCRETNDFLEKWEANVSRSFDLKSKIILLDPGKSWDEETVKMARGLIEQYGK